MRRHFLDLFHYNEWANYRVLITLKEHQLNDTKILTLFSHILTAQIIWLNRIKEIPTSPFPIWEQYKLRELGSMTEESSKNWIGYVEDHRLDTFEEMIFYKNSKGVKYESTVREIMTHVVNHSTYHRGQITLLLRAQNIEPPVTDYTVYRRLK